MTNQLGEDFRVSRTLELVSHLEQFLSQFVRVVDRSVVHQGNFSRRVRVRVRILIRLASVSGPTRVGDPHVVSGRHVRVCAHQIDRIRLVSVARVLCNGLLLCVVCCASFFMDILKKECARRKKSSLV